MPFCKKELKELCGLTNVYNNFLISYFLIAKVVARITRDFQILENLIKGSHESLWLIEFEY